MIIDPYPCLMVITQLLSWIICINGCICILTASPVQYLLMIVYVIQKLGVRRILQFYQRNGKSPWPLGKQRNFGVIPIYACTFSQAPVFLECILKHK